MTEIANKRSRVVRGNGKNKKQQDNFNHEGSEECVICAEQLIYAALTNCNHKTCHKCTFRQRALYEKDICLICRSENESIIITNELNKEYDFFKASGTVTFNEKYKIGFTQDYILNDTLALLDNKCIICSETFPNFKALQDHVKEAHGKYFCLICFKNKKVFISELELFNYKQLIKHQTQGDSLGFKGHPECKYCYNKRFYSEDELNIHIRDKHERCHICKNKDNYYKNYDSLYLHFSRDHYVCTYPECVEKRFVVFGEDIDLTAHLLKEHHRMEKKIQLNTFNQNYKHEEEEDSPEVKKLRFEERAKHYLNYNQDKINQFNKINDKYKFKKINNNELFSKYQELFENQSSEELNILLMEFSDLFPKNSELQNQLKLIITTTTEDDNDKESFPVLGGASPTIFNQSWVHSSANNSTSSIDDKFPALVKPKKSKGVPQQPIKYTTIKKSIPQGKKKLNLMDMNVNYKPNYLDNVNNSKSPPPPPPPPIDSLPALGNSKSSSSLPLSNSSSMNSVVTNSSNKSVDDNKFPALQKKTKKVVIPRVNEVKIDTSSWGKPQNTNTSNENVNGSRSNEIEILDKRKLKLKKKQEKLLFSNGHI
ncbi:unnamed protein product [Candida verbasci]|uniref:RING-type E3 ubiquitin transferase n=1 Tax=Candida verbasci TaxID=1227364 RepID=A0A9W4TZU2_9ASCO|nr:unnamed protein product [Candida verbasci]